MHYAHCGKKRHTAGNIVSKNKTIPFWHNKKDGSNSALLRIYYCTTTSASSETKLNDDDEEYD